MPKKWEVLPRWSDRFAYPIGELRNDGAHNIVGEFYSRGGTEDEGASYATLAAAAPELLSALENLFEQCAMTHKLWGEDCNQKQAGAAIAAARAAIAKAKGGVQ